MDYGVLEDKLIQLFQRKEPDFKGAEELIEQGADVNAVGNLDDVNILSEIISGYWTYMFDNPYQDFEVCYKDLNPRPGKKLYEIIRFFLLHGFDVNKNDGCYGAQCLRELAISTFDRYIIDSTKLLLDAGAKNQPYYYKHPEEKETPMDSIAIEQDFQFMDVQDYALANIYEAVYQIYEAINNNTPYYGIDSYEKAMGKRIIKVLAEDIPDENVFFSLRLPSFNRNNCFNRNLYFVFEDGILITTKYSDFWTDTVLPNKKLRDISDNFKEIIEKKIVNIYFSNIPYDNKQSIFRMPVTFIDFGLVKLRFCTSYGDVKDKKDIASFYEIIK